MFPSTTRPSSYDDSTQATALASAGSLSGGFTEGHCTSGDYEAYQSDANGNRINLRKRDGRNIAFAYDALNRVTAKTYPDGGARPVYYGYDLRNLQLTARFDSQAGEGIANAYDGFGRVSSSTSTMGGTTRTLSYAYNAHGARTLITHPDGIWFGSLLDAHDRPYYSYDSNYAAIALYTYTPFGALDHSAHGAYSFYGYDGLQRPSVRFHAFSGGAGAVLWTYAFNPAGGLGAVTRDNEAFAWTRHYGVSRTYMANGLNQYSLVGTVGYGYDLNGNLTSDGTYTYAYDIENRLVSSSSGAALVYDPLGRLHRVSDATHDTRFLYDGDALVVEYDSNGVVQRRHVHGVGADTAMITYAGADLSTPNNLFADHQGSIIAAANASGATLSVNTYDEYGVPGLGNSGRFQYTGQAWLPELRMYHYKARIYSPMLGRFLQTDPVGYQDQFNLYAYVANDPVNRTDPSGEQSCLSPPCPNIPLISRSMRDRTAASLGRSGRGGPERGLQLYRNRATGEEREARRGYAQNGDYVHIIRRERNESLVILSHVHNKSDQPGTAGQTLTRRNNAPSEGDQAAMHEGGVPVQVVGPHNTGTLYRENDKDYYAVETGNIEDVPNLSTQEITVVDRRREEEGQLPQ